MEFALPVDTFYAFRTNGIGAWGNALDKRMHWGASATRSTTDGFGDSQAEGEYAASGRLTGLPYIDEDGSHLLHTGVSATTRSVDNVRFGTDPELTDVASFVRTQNIDANRQTIGNVEAALILDSFSLQGEYIKNWISDNQTGLSDPSFDGFYAYASYWLTGEQRNYSKKTGKFGRPDVNDPVFEGGCGAWELVGRYSTLDLNDGGVTGGDISNITLGTNWWLNSHTKIAVNYVHSDVENGRNGADGNANMVGTRFQIDF
jgi:phosphate-selective porin OprO/OprP